MEKYRIRSQKRIDKQSILRYIINRKSDQLNIVYHSCLVGMVAIVSDLLVIAEHSPDISWCKESANISGLSEAYRKDTQIDQN